MDHVEQLRQVAVDARASASPRYPVWRSGGAWESGDGGHWAAGFAGAMCDAPPVRLPEHAPIGAFSGFTGYYGRVPEVADAVRAVMLPCGAIGAAEADLVAGGGEAYIDAVGPTAALLAELDPELAARHAYWTLSALQRPDGSMLQIAVFDPETGRLIGRRTGRQGSSPTSAWARAQAWGLLAAAMAGPLTAGTEWDVTEHGRRLTSWWVDRCDPDRLAPWDFDARSGPVDSSASAIASTAMLRMARDESDGERSTSLRRYAERTVRTLCGHLDDRGGLQHGCYDVSLGIGTDAELIWGDHYLMEALQHL